MEPDFWLQRWREQKIGFHQAEINAYLQQYWQQLGPDSSGRVFVPLCGKSRDMLWLKQQGHDVLGNEISPLAVEDFFSEADLLSEPVVREAENFVHWAADGIDILCGDFFHLTPKHLEGCGLVYDRASLVALPQSMRQKYVEHLTSILPAGAGILLVTMEYPQQQMDGPPFSVSHEEVLALYQADYRLKLLKQFDMLADNPRFKERGLTSLVENVYLLQRF